MCMGIFSGLFKSRDKPQNRTSGSGYSFFFRRLHRRQERQRAFRHADDRRVLLRPHPGGSGGGLPLHLYRYKEDGGKERAPDHPLYHLLHDEPNPEMSSFVFRETLMTHLPLWGNDTSESVYDCRGAAVYLIASFFVHHKILRLACNSQAKWV